MEPATTDLEHPKKLTCVSCGYDVTGIIEHSPCPECGTPVNYAEASIPQSTRKAAIGMVLGILSTVTCIGYGAFFGLPSAIAATWISILALSDIVNDRASWHSRSMAFAGLICGVLGLILNSIMLIYVISYIRHGNII